MSAPVAYGQFAKTSTQAKSPPPPPPAGGFTSIATLVPRRGQSSANLTFHAITPRRRYRAVDGLAKQQR